MCAYLFRSYLRGRNVDENLSTLIIPYFVHNVKRSISPAPLYHKTVGFSFDPNRRDRFLWMGWKKRRAQEFSRMGRQVLRLDTDLKCCVARWGKVWKTLKAQVALLLSTR